MTGQQLKNSILQLAIQGKLVPQDPNDEPTSELLKRIRKEKEQMVKAGKLKKKDLEVTPVSEDEKPFEIPESWEWCRLGEIASFQNGDRSKNYPNKEEYVQSGVAWINTGHIEPNGFLSTTTMNYISEEKYNSLSSGKIQLGDLVYCLRGATYGKVSKVDPYTKGAVASSLMIIRPILIVLQEYLLLFLKTSFSKRQLQIFANGAAQPNLAAKDVEKYMIPLPPLAEQKRIVAKIEELLPLVEEYGNAQEELNKLNATLPDKLRQSILQEAIMGKLVPQDPNEEPASKLLERIQEEKKRLVKEGKLKKSIFKIASLKDCENPFDLPSSWTWCKLGEIGEWGAGATPSKGHTEFYSNGTIPWLRTGELNNGFVYDSEIKVSEEALKKCSLRMNAVGDVLIAMYGATIGKVAIAGIPLTTNQACCACTPILIYNKYLLYYLMASKQAFIELGESGAQPNISREKIIEFPFALPPLAEQKRIVEKLEEILPKLNEIK